MQGRGMGVADVSGCLVLPLLPQQGVAYRFVARRCTRQSKARFFMSFGFTPAAWQELADALLTHAADNEVASTEDTAFGTMYVIDGPLLTPDGRAPMIRSVWFLETGQAVPRLATAHPLKKGGI